MAPITRNIVIDEEYLDHMKTYCSKMGGTIDQMVNDYLKKMQEVRKMGISGGEVADALDVFIQYAEVLKDVAGPLGTEIETSMKEFLVAIDAADSFLF